MQDATKSAIENLYTAFNSYKIGNPQEVQCFDFGPSQEEVIGLSNELRKIPDSTLAGMEFYGSGWDSWGTKNEVGYFLPRIMQYIAEDIERLDSSSIFSLFKFKLEGFFSDSNDDWNNEEKLRMNEFMIALIKERLSVNNNIGLLIECALILDFDFHSIISNWKYNKHLYKKQTVALLEHFGCYEYGEPNPDGEYFYDSASIRIFLNSLFAQFNEDEISEIFDEVV